MVMQLNWKVLLERFFHVTVLVWVDILMLTTLNQHRSMPL
ncbi:hypothetical protein HMPREF1141_3293 [Clostridium sp. MSTE9]|nr:hypothetical protein HMPREF1141_3293 [Clostridium sp. MSTE9]